MGRKTTQGPPRPPLRVRAILAQAALLVAVGAVLGWFASNVSQNLAQRNMEVDFGFLRARANFDAPFHILPWQDSDTYARALLVSFSNTLLVSVMAVVAATLLGLALGRNFGLQVIACRPFNMTGPGQAPDYACPAFARQIAMIEAGLCQPVIQVGSLSSKRDFSDVRDIMAACVRLLEKGTPGEIYNMCSGQAVSIREVLDRLLSMSDAKIEVRVDADKLRASENPLIVGDNRKLVAAIGYEPRYSLDQTLRDVLNYWRARIRASDES